ncbi:DUF6463 family protein [Chitinophaga niabensis]|uniref:DUF6463 family protein n=1 Tax=Chitinophaga niabensis TaxID=536979 RepID=UPI0031BBAFDF
MRTLITKHIGNIIIITGVLHLMLGFFVNWQTAMDMYRSGLVNTADQNVERFGFFWFQINGLFVLFTGSFIQHYTTVSDKQIPVRFGYYLLCIALIGCLLEPLSGFYLYAILALFIIFQK